MARVHISKHLLALVLIFLLFAAATDAARSLRVGNVGVDNKKGQVNHMITPADNNTTPSDTEDLAAGDYTPARKKPPIHN